MNLPLSKHPRDTFRDSWLSNPGDIRQRIQNSLLGPSAHDIDHLIEIIENGMSQQRPFSSLVATCLCGELLYCAADNSRKQYDIPEFPRNAHHCLHAPLAALRNALFHPALIDPNGGIPPNLDRVIKIMAISSRESDIDLSKEFRKKITVYLWSPHVLEWALDCLNAAGNHFLRRPDERIYTPDVIRKMRGKRNR